MRVWGRSAQRPRDPLRQRDIVAIATAGLLLAAGAAAIGLTSTGAEHRVFAAITNAGTIAIFTAAGLFALRRNPGNGFGLLLLAAAAGWFVVSFATSDVPGLYSLGRIAAWPEEALLIYLFLAYPVARPGTRAAWTVAGAAIASVLVLYLPTALLVGHYPTPSPYSVCGTDGPAKEGFDPNVFSIRWNARNCALQYGHQEPR